MVSRLPVYIMYVCCVCVCTCLFLCEGVEACRSVCVYVGVCVIADVRSEEEVAVFV